MVEDLDIVGVDVGEGKDWWYVHGRTTHDKVYVLNKQMCDLGKTMNDPMKPLSDEAIQEITKALEITRNPIKSVKPLSDGNFDKDVEELRKILDMEKKTKKMTKAEAFEWLKCKKVNTIGLGEEVQKKLFDCGVKWANGKSEYYDFGDYLLIETNGDLYHCGNCGESYFRVHHFEEIYAHDILSMEIVEENRSEDKLVEIVELGKKIQSLLPKLSGHRHVVITEDDIILREEGMCLFHSDPF